MRGAIVSEFNDWFCSLPAGRQAVLRDDKWRLADNAFQSGFEQAHAEIERLKAQNAELLNALEDMAAQHFCGCNHPACKNCERDVMCRSVIAKAKGGQS